MTKESRAALDAYYAEADSWANDRADALRASRRIAWWVAGGASLIAVCEALALLFLTPLKTVEPYTLMVDRQTGFVQQLKPIDAQMIAPDRALTQSFLVQYVIAREGFDADALQSVYRKVALWSEGSARNAYVAGMQASNSDSPLARLPRSAVIDVAIRSVSSLSSDVALVRFATMRRDAGGQAGATQSWVAVIRYHYTNEAMSAEQRMTNPLGFRVTRYRRSIETLSPSDDGTAKSGPSSPSAQASSVAATGQGDSTPARSLP